ncbi:hypothetical protein DC3_54830 [Deinococcus cellulosilyticus NBRC 106333 = KACC 11606]|uniref:Uncharacterized protein n=1 Tax=Deinococcus cellulosilyticus (strain DSM 18568 / NBRC 106333 / KACC 11606 / 5516J-15) TaxID=1223518 RepID=A0A511NBF7_DEIC1|nr:hypothetical protein DC3_54830 [Deinococcus cellulosilyticus NBRC 106333 = KACC 11606]
MGAFAPSSEVIFWKSRVLEHLFEGAFFGRVLSHVDGDSVGSIGPDGVVPFAFAEFVEAFAAQVLQELANARDSQFADTITS